MFPVWKHMFSVQKLMLADRKHKFDAREHKN